MSSPISYDLQGQGGGVVVTPSSTYTGNFRWIQFVVDSEITTISSSNIDDVTNLVGYAIPAGVGIGGMFTSIELNSGYAIAYYV